MSATLDTMRGIIRRNRQCTIRYRNWRGVESARDIEPKELRFGSNEWHQDPQWLVDAYDMDKRSFREFAVSGILEIEEWRS